jgi:hypothetical protein
MSSAVRGGPPSWDSKIPIFKVCIWVWLDSIAKKAESSPESLGARRVPFTTGILPTAQYGGQS